MKSSLSLRLALLIASAILVSSLITIVLVNSLTASRFRNFSLQRDRNVAQTIADYLTEANEQGTLEQAVLSLLAAGGRVQAHSGMMAGRGALMGMNREGGFQVPLVIADREGVVLNGSRVFGSPLPPVLSDDILSRGIPFYRGDKIGGYVFAGSMLDGNMPDNERIYLHSLLTGVFLSSLFAAVLASVLGFLVLRKILLPLKYLHRGVVSMGRGNYTYRVTPSGGKDEIGQLAQSFNEMARSLEASEEWKKQIISDTAHELRTPVSLIMGNLEMMLDGVYQADEQRLQSLYEESSLLAELIKDLQTLAHTESSRSTLEKEKFDPDELVNLSAEGFKAVAREKNVSLRIESKAGRKLDGDRRKIQQILKNLLSNAIRHTPENGMVSIRSLREGDDWLVEVEDSGPGIPEEERSRVFDRFYRLDKSRNRQDGGAGLGLAISKAIAEMHGGVIYVTSGQEGGALFRLKLPFA